MKFANLIITAIFFIVNLQAQTFDITFTGSGAASTVEDVKVIYLSRGDTLDIKGTDVLRLVTEGTGIDFSKVEDNKILFYPNPMKEESMILFHTNLPGSVNLELYDISGKLVIKSSHYLHAGNQTFSLAGLNTGVYILRADTPDKVFSTRIISVERNSGFPALKHINSESVSKTTGSLKNSQSAVELPYRQGDWLLLKGISGNHKRIVTISPDKSQKVNFEFFACADFDNNHYPVVAIGNQLWMAGNLRTSRFNGGMYITNIESDSIWSGTAFPGSCWVNNDEDNYGHLGKLYNWFASGIYGNPCPAGWHVPSRQEYMTMHQYLIDSGYNFDETTELNHAGKSLSHIMHWTESSAHVGAVGNNLLLNNSSGFSMLPAGRRNHDTGEFALSSTHGMIWLSTTQTDNTNNAHYFLTAYDSPVHETLTDNKKGGYAIRCISKEPAISTGNLIPDPSFQMGTSVWTLEGLGLSIENSIGRTDSRSLKIVSEQDRQSQGVQRQIIGVRGNAEYIYTVWVKGDSVTGLDVGGKPLGWVQWRDGNGNLVYPQGTTNARYIWADYGTYNWKQYRMHLQAPSNARRMDVGMRTWAHVIGGTTYWDDVSLELRTFPNRGKLISTHQAADASTKYNGTIKTLHVNYTGSGYFLPDHNSTRSYLEWTDVDGGTDGGVRILSFRYALEGWAKTWQIIVNGTNLGNVQPINTGYINSWASFDQEVTLLPGNNTVRVLLPEYSSASHVVVLVDKLDIFEKTD